MTKFCQNPQCGGSCLLPNGQLLTPHRYYHVVPLPPIGAQNGEIFSKPSGLCLVLLAKWATIFGPEISILVPKTPKSFQNLRRCASCFLPNGRLLDPRPLLLQIYYNIDILVQKHTNRNYVVGSNRRRCHRRRWHTQKTTSSQTHSHTAYGHIHTRAEWVIVCQCWYRSVDRRMALTLSH